MTQVRTTCVPGLGHQSAQSLRNHQPSRHTTAGGRVTSFANKEGGNSVTVLRCLETKEMQRVGVQCSGSRFPSSVPESVPSMTGAPSVFVDKGSIVKRTAPRSLIQSMQQTTL